MVVDVELLTKLAGFLTERVTDINRPIIADFLEKFLVVEIKKMESPEVVDHPLAEVKPEDTMGETKPPRSGNGHKTEKIRDLFGDEKDSIRNFFISRNGQIENDACVEFKKELSSKVAIFQMTGFVTYMHWCVAAGKLVLTNMESYIEFLQSHRTLWTTYNSPKYRSMRKKLGIKETPVKVASDSIELKTEPIVIEEEELTTPSFAVGYKKARA